MTLAIIVLYASIVVSPAQPAVAPSQPLQLTATGQTSGTAVTQDQASQNQASQNQGTKQSQNQTAPSQISQSQTSQSQTSRSKAAKSQPSSTQKKSSATPGKKSSTDVAHKDQKAKIEGVNCSAAAGSTGAENKKPSADSAPSTSAPSASTSSTQASVAAGTAPASRKSSNCPPTKVVVPEGSTPESSIQLAGGAADPPARDNAKQLLQSTEENLKKIEGQQLTSSQRDMVTQVRQFVAQSKKATEDGDVESARTLAWKAQTLSQDLVTPENK